MKNVTSILLLVFALCVVSAPARADNRDTELINSFISKQAEREEGEEYEDARKVLEGDLNSDGTSDFAVLYTIEGQKGSNNYIQYLAVFIRVKGQLLPVTYTSVGGKSRRGVELESINNNTILLKTINYAPNDPACCPSKESTTRYVLANWKLKEVR